MKEDLIRLLEDNNFDKESNGKQIRYTKELKMNRTMWCELLVIANKTPLLFYKLVNNDNEIYTHNIKQSIEDTINTVNAYITMGNLYVRGSK